MNLAVYVLPALGFTLGFRFGCNSTIFRQAMWDMFTRGLPRTNYRVVPVTSNLARNVSRRRA